MIPNEYNQGDGKTKRIMTRLKKECWDTECSSSTEENTPCEKCEITKESIECFGYDLNAN